MREILFRAKRHKDYGEGWVHGVPFVDYAGDCIMKDNATERVVDPDTVGQYTGLTDKNGTKIFEGDIVLIPGVGYGVIEYDRACFSLGLVECGLCVSEQSEREILGNIHDNPELLEVRHAE